MDTIAGTYYAQAREYAPGVGRFDGEDFIRGFHEIPQTINHYNYCLNNPHKYIDLNGLFLIGAIAALALVGAGVSAAVNAVGQVSNIVSGKQKKFQVGSLLGAAAEGAIVAGVSAIPGLGSTAAFAISVAAGTAGAAVNSTISQVIDNKNNYVDGCFRRWNSRWNRRWNHTWNWKRYYSIKGKKPQNNCYR